MAIFKQKNTYALLRFTSDLLRSLNKHTPFKRDIALCESLTMGDIIDNIAVNNSGNYCEFLGVYIQCQSDGKVLIRSYYSDENNDKRLSKAFSLKKYGFRQAFQLAVQKRADFCGYSGQLPLEKLYIPSTSELLEQVLKSKGLAWVEKFDIRSLLNENL